MLFGRKSHAMPTPAEALPGRDTPVLTPGAHFVNGNPLDGPFPEGFEQIVVGMGCFWGAERIFWQTTGVWVTAVGYSAGFTPNPTYEEVCSGRTGHNEVVRVVFDPSVISFEGILSTFWENHNPTQGMRQGNDTGTQYRSGLYVSTEANLTEAEHSRDRYQRSLTDSGFGEITTEIALSPDFFFAEDYHQQYLAKNPGGYCGIGGTGVSCPIGLLD